MEKRKVYSNEFGKPRIFNLVYDTIYDINNNKKNFDENKIKNKSKIKYFVAPWCEKTAIQLGKRFVKTKEINNADIVIIDKHKNYIYKSKECHDIISVLLSPIKNINNNYNTFAKTIKELGILEYERIDMLNNSYCCTPDLPHSIKRITTQAVTENYDNKYIVDIQDINFFEFGETDFTFEQAELYEQMLLKRSNSTYYKKTWSPSLEDKNFVIESMRNIKVTENEEALMYFFYLLSSRIDSKQRNLMRIRNYLVNKYAPAYDLFTVKYGYNKKLDDLKSILDKMPCIKNKELFIKNF